MEDILKSLTLEFFGSGRHKLSPPQLMDMDEAVLLDVRSHAEADAIALNFKRHNHIDCRHIPVDEIPDRFTELPKDRLIAVFCPANVRSAIVYAYLRTKGFSSVRVLIGGYQAITEAILPGKLLSLSRPVN